MMFGLLKNVFEAFASKQLTAVEIDPQVSNGHEFNASSQLREILGTQERKCGEGTGFPTRCIYFSDDAEQIIEADACLSWYDSRARNPNRTEWRLYYTDNPVFGISGRAKVGDTLIIAFTAGLKSAAAFAAPRDSTVEHQLRWLFGIAGDQSITFKPFEVPSDAIIDATRARILEAIGIEVPVEDNSLLERMLKKFKGDFPRSDAFSAFARAESPEFQQSTNADEILTTWMDKEEFAFRVLEKHIVQKRLDQGFSGVDDFISLSLSVQNRRKSRAGRAFENHLGEVFSRRGLIYEQCPKLEDLTRPDFLFPGVTQYSDKAFPLELLTLLGAKTTCKDRWRQVLSEGKRMKERFLVTLEPAISSNQIAEMQAAELRLVVPLSLHDTFAESDRSGIHSIEEFVQVVTLRQKASCI